MTRLSWKIAALALGALAVSLPARVLNAQELPQVDEAQQFQRVRTLQESAQPATGAEPALYPGEEADTGKQVILETAQPHWNWVNINLDAQYFYTSNAFLSGTGLNGRQKSGTLMLVTTAQGEIDAPPIRLPYGQLFTEVGYQEQRFDYGFGDAHNDVRRLDFDVANVYANAQYDLPGQWTIAGNLIYTRFLNDGNYLEFYKELVPTLRIRKAFNLGDKLRAAMEYSANYRFTDEVPFPQQSRGANNRTDQALDFGLTWQVSQKFGVRPFYRFQYSYYPDYYAGQSRNDFLNTLGVSADYSFNDWSTIRLFLTYEFRNSDASTVPNYQNLDVGAGLSVSLRF